MLVTAAQVNNPVVYICIFDKFHTVQLTTHSMMYSRVCCFVLHTILVTELGSICRMVHADQHYLIALAYGRKHVIPHSTQLLLLLFFDFDGLCTSVLCRS